MVRKWNAWRAGRVWSFRFSPSREHRLRPLQGRDGLKRFWSNGCDPFGVGSASPDTWLVLTPKGSQTLAFGPTQQAFDPEGGAEDVKESDGIPKPQCTPTPPPGSSSWARRSSDMFWHASACSSTYRTFILMSLSLSSTQISGR